MQFPIETEALVVDTPGADFKMTPVFIDELRPDEVLVEMKYSGLCHTDLLVQNGSLPVLQLPAIPGHEGAGIILALGTAVQNKTLRVGDPVLLSFTVCGTCPPCREKRLTKCVVCPQVNLRATRLSDTTTTSTRLADGTPVRGQFFGQSSFSKISAVHEQCVVKCPETVTKEDLGLYAPMGCGFQTGAGTILNMLRPKPYHRVVIFGIGSVGFAALMAAVYLEVRQIIAVDIVEQKLALAKDLGATHLVNSTRLQETTMVDEIKRLTGGRGADFIIETTGVLQLMEQMPDCLGLGGTAALIGAPPAGSEIKLDVTSFFYDNKNLVSVIEGDSYPPEFIPELISLHQQGKFPIDRICKMYAIDDIDTAISEMKSGRVIKPILRFI